MQKLRWLAILMGITIVGITGFQLYWLKNNYDREKQNLEIKTNADFRQTILQLQATKLKLERINYQFESFNKPVNVVVKQRKKDKLPDSLPDMRKEPPITMINLMQEKMREAGGDTGIKKAFIFSLTANGDSLQKQAGEKIVINYGHEPGKKDSLSLNKPPRIVVENHLRSVVAEDILTQEGNPADPDRNEMVRFLYNVDSLSLKDSVTIKEITDAYAAKLKENKMNLLFAVNRLDSSYAISTALNEVTIGFARPMIYRLSLDNEVSYLLKKLTLPILFSLFLVGITVASFVLLYRNLLKQRRLAELKNEFINNITHELKTPIATVGVAIEALQNFNAIHNLQKTKEYLDISQNELQRLSLLVDKVLKLSMFEKKEMELKKEQFDYRQLVKEVMNSMKLQLEQYHAKVNLHTEGENFLVEADKLHIKSVVYNLLDNALKYSKENPVIDIQLKSHPEYIELSVSDNGIGIEPIYKEKIFEKFFRVPSGNRHDTKGYGLGLSYVKDIAKRHRGFIEVESKLDKGSTFSIRLPYSEASVIHYDKGRVIRKEVL